MNSQRETVYDFCLSFNSNPNNIPRFSIEDFYVIVKIKLSSSNKFYSTIYLHLIEYNQPIFTTSSSTKYTPLTTKILENSFESFLTFF